MFQTQTRLSANAEEALVVVAAADLGQIRFGQVDECDAHVAHRLASGKKLFDKRPRSLQARRGGCRRGHGPGISSIPGIASFAGRTVIELSLHLEHVIRMVVGYAKDLVERHLPQEQLRLGGPLLGGRIAEAVSVVVVVEQQAIVKVDGRRFVQRRGRRGR